MDIEDKRRMALRIASRIWNKQDAEDIAQSVVLTHLENPECKQRVQQGVVDWLRKNGTKKRNGTLRVIEVPEMAEKLQSENHRDARELGFDDNLKALNLEERVIITLRYLWGLNDNEIGYCMGMSRGMIIKRTRDAHEKIKDSL